MFKSYAEIIGRVKENQDKQRVAIVAAGKKGVLEAAVQITEENLAVPVLFGNKNEIELLLKEMNCTHSFEIVDCADDNESAHTAVDHAAEGRINLILKGRLDTATLLKAVLRKENGLKESSVLSDILVYEDPMAENEDEKRLIGLTDGGLIPLPDLNTKIEITKSGVKVFKKLGFDKPKVAYISAVEKATPRIQSTVDAVEIKRMQAEGEIEIDAYLDGPFAIDNVISKRAAEIKGIDSVMAGCADILVVPNIEAGNVLGKLVTYYGKARNGHVIMGAKVPILITSRADDAATKMYSVALGILASM